MEVPTPDVSRPPWGVAENQTSSRCAGTYTLCAGKSLVYLPSHPQESLTRAALHRVLNRVTVYSHPLHFCSVVESAVERNAHERVSRDAPAYDMGGSESGGWGKTIVGCAKFASLKRLELSFLIPSLKSGEDIRTEAESHRRSAVAHCEPQSAMEMRR